MKPTDFLSLVALLHAPAALAQPTKTSAEPTTTTSATSTCTASLLTELCDYKEPGPEFAVASSGESHCWEYCNSHTPCKFVIFVAGNPHTGTGTCWLYPGEDFDESQGNSDCGNPVLAVYDQPECDGDGDGDSPTATTSGCKATATPSAVAEVCGYPPPDEDCFNDCYASESATACLAQCAEADSCSYVVFNPNNPSNSPYASGNCWIYADGKYDDELATSCSGDPEQFVYKNLCPKPKPSSTTTSPAGAGTAAVADSTTDSDDLAPTGLSRNHLLAIGMAALIL